MTRQDYIYQLAGRITSKQIKKKKDGNNFYQLSVIIPEQERVKKINVFTDSCEKKNIWQIIEANKYISKEYLFFCKNFMGSYYLVDWQELANSSKELTNHGSN